MANTNGGVMKASEMKRFTTDYGGFVDDKDGDFVFYEEAMQVIQELEAKIKDQENKMSNMVNINSKPDKWSIEPHGDGFALYQGRDSMHHGSNLLHITNPDPKSWDRVKSLIESAPALEDLLSQKTPSNTIEDLYWQRVNQEGHIITTLPYYAKPIQTGE